MHVTKQMIMSYGTVLLGTALNPGTAQKILWTRAVKQSPKIKKAVDKINKFSVLMWF